MEDDDEFGDLYTDVLSPFSSASTNATTSSSVPPQPHQPSATPGHLHHPIDLNLQTQDDDQTLFVPQRPIADTQTLAPFKSPPPDVAAAAAALVSIPNRDSAPEPLIRDSKQESPDGKDVKFDIEEGVSNGIEYVGSEDPIIPGLTESVPREDSGRKNNGFDNGIGGGEAEGEGDDWDSDSEDDLQIVLNDNNHGPMAMERGGMMEEEEDDDEDGDPLVIVADGDANQGIEEQDWGEEGGQTTEGDKKEGGEAGKAAGTGGGGGSLVAQKIGYNNHGYHSFHSQFKVSVLT